ncbi:hypothetical protein BU26DRAFT_558521 [Trematosphaeria pertusa]|uniref:Uncharacterized protein n=1 Tax=Trematosphaeria pertusa TaxID=390896 RepID=A0A6A6J323_9PLEO|nr:uncharacterized protein BU26DRAFT_558521 [Trematosphaeria pertusa]KAF2257109.1 hypothetical protein BU26DRAFT_558521 [Trematosphaeria pertusa]
MSPSKTRSKSVATSTDTSIKLKDRCHGTVTTTCWSDAPTKSTRCRSWTCENPRARCPEIEAKIQILFRVLSIILHFGACIFVTMINHQNFYGVEKLYRILSYCMLLNAIEILCLANPTFTLRLSFLPRLRLPFTRLACRPPRTLHVSRFPRIPSIFLAVAEGVALAITFWSMLILLEPGQDTMNLSLRLDCPIETCVTSEENLSICAFALQNMNAVFHIGFLVMSVTHWAKRMVPIWVDYFEWC